MTAKNLTEDDLANYVITFADPDAPTQTVTAAYIATEPGWLLFKDHEHRVVAQVHQAFIAIAQRMESGNSRTS